MPTQRLCFRFMPGSRGRHLQLAQSLQRVNRCPWVDEPVASLSHVTTALVPHLAENRCATLKTAKGKSLECCELEDQYESEIRRLNTQLAQAKRISPTEERHDLPTTIDVLEADVKCLRAEMRRIENIMRQRRDSALNDLSGAEMTAASATTPSPLSREYPLTPHTQDTNTTTLSPPTSELLNQFSLDFCRSHLLCSTSCKRRYSYD
ncbi:hypothetical protein J6590_055433 [Homalodisca vitripennis]|nr:hypothetical protein J6590_055433 [Homalodisca vitripennis]